MPWAYIQEDTCFFMPRMERSLLQFENLPYPFSRDDDLDATTIILPDQPQRQDLVISGNIAELLGLYLKKNKGVISVAKGWTSVENRNSDNLIIFGTPSENSAVKAINQSLWFKYDDQFTAVLSNEKMNLLPETSKTAAFWELKPSPYNERKGMLTITSIEKETLQDSLAYLKDDKRILLKGDAAIISKDGELTTLRFQKDEIKRPVISSGSLSKKIIWDYVIFAGAVLLLMTLGLILYLYKNSNNKKNIRTIRYRRGKRSRRGKSV